MKKSSTYVGLDVHSASITIAVLEPGARKPKISQIQNDTKSARRVFGRLKKGARLHCCYEAGPCGFELYRLLSAMGIHCEVIAPALIPKKPGERIKTDRRDAAKLARLSRAGELTAIRVPSEDEEAVRDLLRARGDVRKDLMSARHRLSKFLLRHGRVYGQGKNWTQRYWRWLRAQTFDREAEQTVFEHYQLQVHHQLERLAALDKEIAAFAAAPTYQDDVDRLSCLRGISTLSAMILITELQDFRRFEHPRDLMGFVGIVPSERSSGKRQRRGGITKTGNTHVRRVLVEAAWSYRRRPAVGPQAKRLFEGQPPEVISLVKKAQTRLHGRYRHLVGKGKISQVAITAVARELCGFIWALMTYENAA
jgi:transposase